MRISDCSSDVCSSDLTEPNPQDGRSNAALARIVYDPANGHKLRLTGEYLDTHLYTNGLTGLSASVERLEGFDSGERKRVSLDRPEEHTSELQSLMRISYAVFCLNTKITLY